MTRFRPPARRLGAGIVLGCALVGATAGPASADEAEYQRGYELGTKAYQYGVPLLNTARLFKTNTSVNVDDGRGNGPVNRFHHLRRLADASDRSVVSPNQDTLYSLGWLDLRRGPVVIRVPAIEDRFYTIPLYTPYQENFFNISSVNGDTKGGKWVVVPPRYKGKLPKGVKKVRAPYNRVWVLGRTYVKNGADAKKVNRIQDRYTLTPLSKNGKKQKKPRRPARPDTKVHNATIPGSQPGQDPLSFYSALSRELLRFRPPAADKPILSELKAIRVGPGLDPGKGKGIASDTLRGMRDAVTKGPAGVQQLAVQKFIRGFEQKNGYLTELTGRYGTDYAQRAVVDKIGLGAPQSKIAIYPYAQTDRTRQPLTGAKRYVLHLDKSRLPIPAKAFWSLTLYDMDQFFVPNALDRYLLNDRSNLRENPDGTVDLYIQHERPKNPDHVRNWLPAPQGTFNVLWRLYDPGTALKGIVDGSGWTPPAIQACDATGRAADGTACAS